MISNTMTVKVVKIKHIIEAQTKQVSFIHSDIFLGTRSNKICHNLSFFFKMFENNVQHLTMNPKAHITK